MSVAVEAHYIDVNELSTLLRGTSTSTGRATYGWQFHSMWFPNPSVPSMAWVVLEFAPSKSVSEERTTTP